MFTYSRSNERSVHFNKRFKFFLDLYATIVLVKLVSLWFMNLLSDVPQLSSSIEDSATTLGTIRSILFQLKTPSNSVKDQSKFINEAEEIVALESMENELTRLQREWQSLFLWHDGPLVEAMRNGDFFLIDEISLADDSVLERLNSVLEPKRLLVSKL